MRTRIGWAGSAALTLALLSLLLKPFIGELKAALLSAAVVIGFNLICVDACRGRDEFEVDRLLGPVRLTYTIALVWPIGWPRPNLAHLLLQISPDAPHTIGYHVVFLTIALAMAGVMHLLCRLSFSADEIRGADRRTFERLQGRTFMEKICEQIWGGPRR